MGRGLCLPYYGQERHPDAAWVVDRSKGVAVVSLNAASFVVATALVSGLLFVATVPATANASGLGGISSGPAYSGPIAGLGGSSMLDQLAALPRPDLEAFGSAHPEKITRLLAEPPTAKSVATWWSLTPQATRGALEDSVPALVGNLDGLPADVRDAANRVVLEQEIADATAELPNLGRSARVAAKQRLHMLQEIDTSLDVPSSAPKHSLLTLDTTWPGRAAIAIGDLETAEYVSYFVPGMWFSTDRLIVEWTVIAEDLYTEQTRWAREIGRDDPALRGASVATIAWIGYETPGVVDVGSLDLARTGATALAGAVGGVQADRVRDDPFVTLLAHSYGSTASLMAIANGGVDVDALVLIGSPGGGATSVAGLGMTSDQVYVGEADGDFVTASGFFGSNPGSSSFGASSMNVSGGEDPLTGDDLAGAPGHLGYFDRGSESMRNMALVGLGRGDLVTTPTHPDR